MKKAISLLVVFIMSITLLSPYKLFAMSIDFDDNNEDISNQYNNEVARKLAVLDCFPDLINSGVTEISFSNYSTVDDLVDDVWNLIVNVSDNGSEYLNANDIYNVNILRSQLREKYLDYSLQLANQGINLNSDSLDDFLENFLFDTEYHPHDTTIHAFNSLSKIPNNNTPNPDPSYFNQLNNINHFYISNTYDYLSSNGWILFYNQNNDNYRWRPINYQNISYLGITTSGTVDSTVNLNSAIVSFIPVNPFSIRLTQHDGYVSAVYDSPSVVDSEKKSSLSTHQTCYYTEVRYYDSNKGFIYQNRAIVSGFNVTYQQTFNNLQEAINYIEKRFRHINLYVDNVPWLLITQVSSPTIDIDGLFKMYGTNDRITYQFPDDCRIDYNKLYLVIKNAINGLGNVSNTTINNNQVYKDSHNTIISPIINNYYNSYGSSEDEGDIIDSILDVATIPNFDIALIEPIDQPFFDGYVAALYGIQVIPSDILLVFGAIFVLFLFVLLMCRFLE